MYLQISARRTGKTTRLINELNNHLSISPDNWVFLTVPTMRFGKHIKERVNPRYMERLLINDNFECHYERLQGIMLPDDPRILYMWDEFDFIQSAHNVPVMRHGYYTTTPRFPRCQKDWANWQNDLLLRLLVENDYKYTNHHGKKASAIQGYGSIESATLNLGVENFKNEFMSGWL